MLLQTSHRLAGVPGFEPGNAGIKNRCLTAWRYPNTVAVNRKHQKYGWGTWIRTRECRYQKPVPYRLAIPQQISEQRTSDYIAVSLNGYLTAWRYPIHATLTGEWCGRRDLNSHTLRRQNLNLVRLPISPLPQKKMVATTGIEPVTPAL